MELLMKNGSQIVTKEQLILKVWGYDSAAEDNNVEVYISFLRRKLTHLQSESASRHCGWWATAWRWRHDTPSALDGGGHQYAAASRW